MLGEAKQLATLPPPHPDPHGATGWQVPSHACDSHCHIFGPEERFPYLPTRSYQPCELPLENYEQLQAALGFERAVFVQPAVYGTGHDAMEDALVRGNGRYRAIGIFNDQTSDEELKRLDAIGFRGARYNYVGHLGGRPSRETVLRMAERIKPLGWHLVFHVDAGSLADEAAFLAELPITIVIDHMARLSASQGTEQEAFRTLLKLAAMDHVWTKISAADRMVDPQDLIAAIPFMRALAETAPTRTLWGTDWPHPNSKWMPDDGDLLDNLAAAIPDPALREAILVTNPARLFGF